MKYATRVNSFLRTGRTLEEAIAEIGTIEGVQYIDLNYPEHFQQHTSEQIAGWITGAGLQLNALNLRFRQEFLNGEFGNANSDISEQAVRLCKEAADLCNQLGGTQLIVWLGFDGFDYSFQIDYNKVWKQIVDCFRQVCAYAACPVSIEYKPYEERVHAFIDSFGTATLIMQEVGCDNLGITLDFCHMLMKKENPACAAALLLERGKLFSVHVNDGEGSTDDGLIVGMSNPWKMLELFYYLKKYSFQGILYFDTFPKREDAARETMANIAMCRKLEQIIDRLGLTHIGAVIAKNDAVEVQKLIAEVL